jgi:hypothetical protein
LAFHVEVDFSRFPFVTGFTQEGSDQPQEGRFVGEDACHAGAAFEFHVDAFEGIGGTQTALMGRRQQEHAEALGEVVLHPAGKFGGAFGVVGDDLLEPSFGCVARGAFKDAADAAGHLGALVQAWDVSLGVLLEVELAALPGDGAKDGLAGGGQAGMIVADDVGDAAEAALDEALEEGAPMDLGFAEGDADPQDGALAVGVDPQGNEDGAIAELAVVTDLFVTGVKDEIRTGAEGPVAPLLQFVIEALGAVAHLGGTDGGAAEFFDNGGDLAGGNALHVHFGHGEFEGLLGAEAFSEGGGVEVGFAADLRDAEGDGTDAAGEGFGFIAVGVTFAGFGAFVGVGLEDVMAFEAHGFVDEEAQAFGEAVVALFSQELQDVAQEFRIGGVGHLVFGVGCVGNTPTGNQYGLPSTSFSRAPLHPSGVRLRCGSLRSPPLRLTPEGWRQMEERQFTERNLHPLFPVERG